MPLAPAHKTQLVGQAVTGFAVNFLLNGAVAWVSFPQEPSLPLFARGNCVAGDTIGTSFFLPLITCLVLTSTTRRSIARGSLAPLARDALPGAVRWLPRNMLARGALVSLACALTVAPATLAALNAAGVHAMTRGEDVLFKAIYTAFLGLGVTPLLGLRALGDG